MIKRESYLKQIEPFIGCDLIKVITGIRRCGKSVILRLVREKLLEKAISVAKRIISGLAALRQNRVREVVVLVNEHVELHALVHQSLGDARELRDAAGRSDYLLGHPVRQPVAVRLRKGVDAERGVVVEAGLRLSGVLADGRKVEVQHEVPAALVSRVRTDVGAGEELLETVGKLYVVVGAEH